MSNMKVAIVTGAGRGLGSAIAEALAAQGVHVALSGRTESTLVEVQTRIHAAGGTAAVLPADVSNEDSVQRLFAECVEEFGNVDILVNNAGVTGQIALDCMSESDWQRIFDTNRSEERRVGKEWRGRGSG